MERSNVPDLPDRRLVVMALRHFACCGLAMLAVAIAPLPATGPMPFGWSWTWPAAEAKSKVRVKAKSKAKAGIKARAALAKAKARAAAAALKKARARAKLEKAPATAPVVSIADPTLPPQPTLPEMRAAVLAAPADKLRSIGRHLIVGYHNAAQLTPLLDKGALGGVFVTARNARGRAREKLAAEIAGFRALANKAGQHPFWISTDQEGGGVSRLSPPLPYQPSLARLVRDLATADARDAAVTDFADRQAEALAGIGVNLNFAPVADLNLDARNARDQFTRLRYRAVSADPLIVSDVARTYCERLLLRGVACTLKHFPGIGRVIADTHITPATLKTPRNVLAEADWVPFRRVVAATPAFVMVGHPHLAAVDTEARPASTSSAVIDGIVRKELGFGGVVVTDDLAMGAIRRRKGGMPRAAVDAMVAGADLVLLGLDGDQIYAVLYAMLEAEKSGEIPADKLMSSDARLRKAAEMPEPVFAVPPPPVRAPRSAGTGALDTRPARTVRQQ